MTCVSPSNCWAVGLYFNGIVQQTLIERWDGTSWAIVTSPNTSDTQDNLLLGMTCVSASECWAVGYYKTEHIYQTLIERWDGSSWTIVSSPNTATTQSNVLVGVTCVSASNCWAVGYYSSTNGFLQTLIERWDGSSWAIVTSPSFPLRNNELVGVTCVSASECWAVGDYAGIAAQQTLIERWDGTAWAIVSSPNTGATQANFLYGVTCVSTSECWAIGYYKTGGISQTLIERWDGTLWTIVSSPNTSTTLHNFLAGVTCESASSCWAVGYYDFADNFTGQTLIERWDGTSWAIVTSPNSPPTRSTNFLFDVTCVSASECWAVGYYQDNSAYQTLIERWNGTSWAIVSSPNTSAAQANVLNRVTCASAAAECWAAGYFQQR